MTVQSMWPLFFLVFIPVIILLYILKQKAKDVSFSSTMLWQEIYKNLEAKTPFEKLKHNILMYLQIFLMALLIFSLMAPSLKNGGKADDNLVIVMDTSASMDFLYDNNHTRLEEGIARAIKEADQVSEDTMVTLIAVDEDARIVYQGKDKITLKKRLKDLKTNIKVGNLNVANDVVNSVVSSMSQAFVIGYTDTAFDDNHFVYSNENAAYQIESLYSEGENASVCYVNYSVNENQMQALCKVMNYGDSDITTDVSLYVGNQIADVQTVTVPAKDSQIVYFKEQAVPVDQGVVARAEISEKDSLQADNEQSVEIISSETKNVLILSQGNVFLEKALSLDDNIEIYKADTVSVLEQNEEPIDLYVFDGIEIPEDFKLPDNASCIFMNYDSIPAFSGLIDKQDNLHNQYVRFLDAPITEYVEQYSFGVSGFYTYALPDWARAFAGTEDGKTVGYYGEAEGRRVAVLGFDIHSTDLALQTEFPIFMSQLNDYLLRVSDHSVEIENFPEVESDVEPAQDVAVTGNTEIVKTGGRALRNMLLVIVLLLLIIEWIIYIKQVRSSKKIQFLCFRCLLMLMIVLAMAGLSVTKKQAARETIFLVDVSDSMAGNITEAEKYIKNMIHDMPENNKAGVIAFGKDTAVDQFVTEKKVFANIDVAPVTTATNIEKAVQSACSMFNEGVVKQLVLITDGSENEGSMTAAATALKAGNVSLSTIVVEDSISKNKEVYIDQLNVPSVIHAGDHFNIVVSVVSNTETNATISLFAGRAMKGTQEVMLNKGTNKFVFEDEGIEGSIANYKAVVEAAEDTIQENNTYVAFSQIESKPKVLLVESKSDEAKEFEKILDASNIGYDRVTSRSVPVALSELNQYKAVITVNVHHDDLRNGFDQSLETYVKEFAGGFICIGGDNSYALGNYKNTVLEEILPVEMDLQGEREIPKMAMAMVIDQSGSMSAPSVDNASVTGLDLAKQAAVAGADQFRPNDEIGVLAFDDSYHWIVPFRQADDMPTIKHKIQTIAEGGGTSIYPAVQEAYNQVIKSDAQIKHIILLTDGQDEFRDYNSLVNSVKNAGVTVSCVAVGSDSDQKLLKSLAERCGGRFYYTDVNNSIPRIFAQEVYLSAKAYLVNESFYPTITSNNAMIEGVFDEGIPMLNGYIAATAKQTADVLLVSDSQDPILSTWQYGLGKTVAWNSDGTNEWTSEYAKWEKYPQLWSNIIHSVIDESDLGGDSLEVNKEGSSARVVYETENYDKDTKVSAVVTDEDGNVNEIPLETVRPGVYEVVMPTDNIGVYSISIRKNQKDELVANYNTAYANQYSMEYQFSDNSGDVQTFTKQANGEIITLNDSVWNKKIESVEGRVPLTTFFLILAVVLWMIDILLRRLSVDYVGAIKGFVTKQMAGRKEKQAQKAEARQKVAMEKQQTTMNQQKDEVPVTNSTGKSVDGSIGNKVDSSTKATDTKVADSATKKSEKVSKKEPDGKKQKEKPAANSDMLDMNQLLKKKKDRE